MTRTVLLFPALCAFLFAADAGAKGKGFGGPHIQIGLSGGRLGAQISNMTEELRAFFGAPTDAGVLVGQVEPDSPAAKAGLKVGDVVVDVDGAKVDSPTDVLSQLADKQTGAKVALGIVRDKKRQSLTATLRDRPGNKAFGMDMNMEPGMGMHAFAFDTDQFEKLEQKIEELTRRLEKLEQKGK